MTLHRKNNKKATSTPQTKHGFTIVELLIVIVVIGILAAISIVAYNGIQQKARESRVAQQLTQLRKQMELYRVEHGEWPFQGEINERMSRGIGADSAWCMAVTDYILANRASSGALPDSAGYDSDNSCLYLGGAKNTVCAGVYVSQVVSDDPWETSRRIFISRDKLGVSPYYGPGDDPVWCFRA